MVSQNSTREFQPDGSRPVLQRGISRLETYRTWPTNLRRGPPSRRYQGESGRQAPLIQLRFVRTRPSVMGTMMSSLPSERLVAELMLLSVVNAWPPHHAVRGSGEPI